MRRPLLAGCLCLAAVTAIRLITGAGITPLPRFAPNTELTVTGRVSQKSEDRITLQDLTILSDTVDRQLSFPISNKCKKNVQLICRVPDAELMLLGSMVTVSGFFAPFEEARNPGQFDFYTYYRSLNVAGTLYRATVLSEGEEYSRLSEQLYAMRLFWKNRLYAVFPEKEASVIATMLLGEKRELDRDLKELYRRNGIIHILSISGLHITLIGMGIYRLLRYLRMRRGTAAFLGGSIVLLYGLLTGMSVSACRAILMYLLRMLGTGLGRTYDMLTALGLAAAGLLLYNPYYLEHAGFLLSFSSIAGIGVLYPALASIRGDALPVQKYIESPYLKALSALLHAGRETLLNSLLAGFSITLMTLPVQLWFYFEIPSYTILLNLLVLPFMGVLMITGFFVMLLPGTGILGTIPYLILHGYEKLCTLADTLPHHSIVAGRPEVWKLALYYGCILWVVVRGRKRKTADGHNDRLNDGRMGRHRGESDILSRFAENRFLQVLPLALAALLLLAGPVRRDEVTFLDVGQGDCIVVQTKEGHVYVTDCGSSSVGGVGTSRLIPYLKYKGIDRVDILFLSHADRDHTNGAAELLAASKEEGIEVGAVMIPDVEAEYEKFEELFRDAGTFPTTGDAPALTILSAGMKTGLRGEILCLRPGASEQWLTENEASLCLYVKVGELSLLLPGDTEGAGEELLRCALSEQGITRVDCLKAAHHGSKNATGENFLDGTDIGLCVISCGENNPYGHPHEEMLERLLARDIPVLTTSECGAVTLRIRGQKVRVETYLDPGESKLFNSER